MVDIYNNGNWNFDFVSLSDHRLPIVLQGSVVSGCPIVLQHPTVLYYFIVRKCPIVPETPGPLFSDPSVFLLICGYIYIVSHLLSLDLLNYDLFYLKKNMLIILAYFICLLFFRSRAWAWKFFYCSRAHCSQAYYCSRALCSGAHCSRPQHEHTHRVTIRFDTRRKDLLDSVSSRYTKVYKYSILSPSSTIPHQPLFLSTFFLRLHFQHEPNLQPNCHRSLCPRQHSCSCWLREEVS